MCCKFVGVLLEMNKFQAFQCILNFFSHFLGFCSQKAKIKPSQLRLSISPTLYMSDTIGAIFLKIGWYLRVSCESLENSRGMKKTIDSP